MADPDAHTRRLQNEIDEAVQLLGPGWIGEVRLGRGSEVMDLTQNVDVEPYTVGGRACGEVSIRSTESMKELCDRLPFQTPHGLVDMITMPDPCAVVQKITGETILRAIIELQDALTSPSDRPAAGS